MTVQFFNSVRRHCALSIVLALSACGGSSLPDRQAPMTIANLKEGYVLEPGNHLRLTVFNEANLSGEFTIDGTGNLSIPLVGTVEAAGVNAQVLASRIGAKIREEHYLNDPKVSVEVLSFRPVYVLGEVRSPGEFPYVEGMTILSAVARAGGYDYRASEGEVLLIRVEGGKQQEYSAIEYTPVQPGDIIRVRERHF